MKVPAPPLTVPGVVVPSPHSIVAVKLAAVSPPLLSLKVATGVLLGSAVPSVAAVSTIWPAKLIVAVPIADLLAVPGASSATVTLRMSFPPAV